MDADVKRDLHRLRVCPATFQEFIEAGYDVRVTWVDGVAFAMRIRSDMSMHPEDSRRDYAVPHEAYDLEPEVCRALERLMDDLGLIFGAIDLRYDRNGTPYFLEVNPAGQFAYVEILTGMPVIAELGELLIRGRSQRRIAT